MSDFQYARMLVKAGAEFPTIPTTEFHDDSEWLNTDIYENELYVHTSPDVPLLYTRKGESIVRVGPSEGDTSTYGFGIKSSDQAINGQDPVAITEFSFTIPAGKITTFEVLGGYVSSRSSNGIQLRFEVVSGEGLSSALGSMYAVAGIRGTNTIEAATTFLLNNGESENLELLAVNADSSKADYIDGKGIIDARNADTDGLLTIYAWNEAGGETVTIKAGSSLKNSSYSA